MSGLNHSNNIIQLYQLDDCHQWLVANGFKKVVIQAKKATLKHSRQIVEYLEGKFSREEDNGEGRRPPEFFVTQANTCCLDLLVTQHVTNIDAIIHIGQVCLTQPVIKNQSTSLIPSILFSFGNPKLADKEKFHANLDCILKEIKSELASPSCRLCILYDTSLIEYANSLNEYILEHELEEKVSIANLNCPNAHWNTTPNNQARFIRKVEEANQDHLLGQYYLKHALHYYNCVLYIGESFSFQLALECPSKLLQISFNNSQEPKVERINQSKLLNRRIALVNRLKDEEELKIGVLITNPLPDLISVMQKLESYSKPRKHTLYFISMVQTIDDCKIGNFDLCDAFIVINSCNCATILESFVFNRPIITELEYKLACGFEGEYGRVLWPGTSSHLTEEDMFNKRKVSDVSLALIHTRNELLERCSQARANKWSGMDFKASSDKDNNVGDDDGCGGGVEESLDVEEGLKGIASVYVSEPLKKVDHVKESGTRTRDGGCGDVDGGISGGADASHSSSSSSGEQGKREPPAAATTTITINAPSFACSRQEKR